MRHLASDFSEGLVQVVKKKTAKRAPQLMFYGIILLVLAGGLYLGWERVLLTRPLPAGARVVVRTFYTLSKREVDSSAGLPDKKACNTLDLLRLYPAKQGWKLSFAGGEAIFTRTVDGLSPDDQNKSHLGEKGGFVTVVRGPAGINGGIIRVTTIPVSILPADYQKQAVQGTLDLPDEVSLLQILDSLDENNGSE
ncbi:MAG: hypothetical protein ABSA82_06310 [Thermacetogeniaceae bacterium]